MESRLAQSASHIHLGTTHKIHCLDTHFIAHRNNTLQSMSIFITFTSLIPLRCHQTLSISSSSRRQSHGTNEIIITIIRTPTPSTRTQYIQQNDRAQIWHQCIGHNAQKHNSHSHMTCGYLQDSRIQSTTTSLCAAYNLHK